MKVLSLASAIIVLSVFSVASSVLASANCVDMSAFMGTYKIDEANCSRTWNAVEEGTIETMQTISWLSFATSSTLSSDERKGASLDLWVGEEFTIESSDCDSLKITGGVAASPDRVYEFDFLNSKRTWEEEGSFEESSIRFAWSPLSLSAVQVNERGQRGLLGKTLGKYLSSSKSNTRWSLEVQTDGSLQFSQREDSKGWMLGEYSRDIVEHSCRFERI